jgi:hypothetical protein
LLAFELLMQVQLQENNVPVSWQFQFCSIHHLLIAPHKEDHFAAINVLRVFSVHYKKMIAAISSCNINVLAYLDKTFVPKIVNLPSPQVFKPSE